MRRAELLAMFAVFVVLSAMVHACQARTSKNQGRGWDGEIYHAMATQALEGHTIAAELPYVYRIGTVQLAVATGERDLLAAFYHVNLVANALTVLLLTLWLRRSGAPVWATVSAQLFWLLHWLAPLRFSRFYPANVDAWVFPFLIGGLLLMEPELRRQRWARLAFWALVPAGVFFREVILVLPLIALVPPRLRHGRDVTDELGFALPALATGLLAWWLVRASVIPLGPYQFTATALSWWHAKDLLALGLGWLNVFGPLLLVLLLTWRSQVGWLKEHLHLVAYLAVVFVLSWVGGSDIERFALWAAPVLLLLGARALARWQGRYPLLFVTGVLALLTTRALFSIPQDTVRGCHGLGESFLAPVGPCIAYLDLYFWHASGFAKLQQLLWHAFSTAVLLAMFTMSWLERRAQRQPTPAAAGP
jgi:hypothetical protein